MRVGVAVVQMDCILGDKNANVAHIDVLAREAASLLAGQLDPADHRLVIFPECATTGYFVGEAATALAEPSDGPTNGHLARLAADLGAHMAVGVIESEGDDVYDSLAVFSPTDGLLASYRKVHLFAGEKAVFAVGDEPCLVDTPFGIIGLTICYDLMFPEYVRGLVLSGARLVINGTDWITDPWQTSQGWTGDSVRALCNVRALENGVHVAMADRVGEEAGFTSLGHSTIASPAGGVLACVEDGEGIGIAVIEDPTADLDRWRSYATYLHDRRPAIYAELGVEGRARRRSDPS
jgi:predicted amidohydrolase